MGDSRDSESLFKLTIGQGVRDDEGLYRVTVDGRDVLWIPGEAQDLQIRLMICAHMKDACHRGVATLQRLQEYCCWAHMEAHVREFVKQCLH